MQKQASKGLNSDTRSEAKRRSMKIDAMIKAEQRKKELEVHYRLLVLGPADSGKSTLLKQLCLIYGTGFTPQERQDLKIVIQHSIIRNLKALVIALQHYQEIDPDPKVENAIQIIDTMYMKEDELLDESVGLYSKILWESPGIKKVFQTAAGVLCDDNLEYLLTNVGNFFSPNYTLTDEDVLICRRKTEQITETIFNIDNQFWHFVDVSGQRDKRQKWAAYFDRDISGIVYVFSCVAYNQTLEEAPDQNRILDALQLYESLLEHPLLKPSSIIILMNKTDLLKDRIAKYQIKDYLPHYTGKNERDAYIEFLRGMFTVRAENTQCQPFIFKTKATDTKMMRKIILSVRESVMQNISKSIGFA
ncbi:guanine nucleotide binding protein, alpha subunit [Gorgonomyces haynaldii]|nr:guanine nucleotide binding protein, alpha subunit [Gorgonomyces haynaldii]